MTLAEVFRNVAGDEVGTGEELGRYAGAILRDTAFM